MRRPMLIPLTMLLALATLAPTAGSTAARRPAWTASGPAADTVNDLELHPRNDAVLFAATQYPPLYRSSDAAGSWRMSGKGIRPNTGAPNVAIARSKPTFMYLATFGYTGPDQRLYRSTDGGATWRRVSNGLPAVDAPSSQYMDVAIHPRDHRVAFVATRGSGVYRTTDAGTSWVQVNTGLTGNALYVESLAVAPGSPYRVFAGTWAGVFRTTNGGDTWTDHFPDAELVTDVAVHPRNPSVAYATTFSDSAGGAVYKTTDGGDSWSPVDTGLPVTHHYETVAFARSRPSTVYVGGSGGVFRTTNGGGSWSSFGLTDQNVFDLAVDSDEPSRVYAAADGIFVRRPGSTRWLPRVRGISNARMLDVAASVTDPDVVFGASAGFGVFRSLDGGRTWASRSTGLPNGDTPAIALHPRNPDVAFVAVEGDGVFRTQNGGGRWRARNEGLTDLYAVALAMSPSDPSVLYMGTDSGDVFRTRNAGGSWTEVSTGLPGDDILSLAVHPTNRDVVYVGTYGAGVYRTTNGGDTWSARNTDLTDPYPYSLAIHPVTPSIVLAGTEDGIFRTTNGGGSWNHVLDVSCCYREVHGLAFDPRRPANVYAGLLHTGAFRSTDGGRTWQRFNNGLQMLEVEGMAVSGSGTVHAATDGGGVWRIRP
jgi:photosystem II stability/assembly factor-like uncharacterized protein